MRKKLIESQISSFLKSLEPNKIVLFIVNPKKYHSVHAEILKGSNILLFNEKK
jgi:hypothetical protein